MKITITIEAADPAEAEQICARLRDLNVVPDAGPPLFTLSTRARNCIDGALRQSPYYKGERLTPEVVSRLSRREMSCTPDVGKVTLTEIEGWLATHGLAFRV